MINSFSTNVLPTINIEPTRFNPKDNEIISIPTVHQNLELDKIKLESETKETEIKETKIELTESNPPPPQIEFKILDRRSNLCICLDSRCDNRHILCSRPKCKRIVLIPKNTYRNPKTLLCTKCKEIDYSYRKLCDMCSRPKNSLERKYPYCHQCANLEPLKESFSSSNPPFPIKKPPGFLKLFCNGEYVSGCISVGGFIITNSHSVNSVTRKLKWSVEFKKTKYPIEYIDSLGDLSKFRGVIPGLKSVKLAKCRGPVRCLLQYYSKSKDTIQASYGSLNYGTDGYFHGDFSTEVGSCGFPYMSNGKVVAIHEASLDSGSKIQVSNVVSAISATSIAEFVYGLSQAQNHLYDLN